MAYPFLSKCIFLCKLFFLSIPFPHLFQLHYSSGRWGASTQYRCPGAPMVGPRWGQRSPWSYCLMANYLRQRCTHSGKHSALWLVTPGKTTSARQTSQTGPRGQAGSPVRKGGSGLSSRVQSCVFVSGQHISLPAPLCGYCGHKDFQVHVYPMSHRATSLGPGWMV